MTTKKILFVDDELLYHKIYGEPLEKAGFTVSYASNGEAALKLCKKNQFDLLIIDLVMPIMSGLVLLKKLPQNAGPAIVLTVLESDTDREDAIADGAKQFFMKTTLDATQLVEAVNKMLT